MTLNKRQKKLTGIFFQDYNIIYNIIVLYLIFNSKGTEIGFKCCPQVCNMQAEAGIEIKEI